MDDKLENAMLKFVKSIKETDIYQKYYDQREKLKKHPEQYQKVNEFRRRNFEIQNTTHQDELFDKMDAFEQEYEKFREDPLVDDFLRAELAFCRMMQEITLYITEKVDFE
ncbi:MAG: YlbF family regulator [Eubacterium sp.]|nr:YlbF family regulator [Lachnospiraceae bacterium]MBO5485304.1 YlbF family regulator [Eubacterium sp.]